jgi:hypothetical protein
MGSGYWRGIMLAGLWLALGACTQPRERVTTQITPESAKELRLEAAKLYKQLRASPAPEYIPLKKNVWPAAFVRLSPERVGLYRDGVALAMEGNASTEKGVHIVPQGMEFSPPTGRARYEKLQEGIFWYSLGK